MIAWLSQCCQRNTWKYHG